MCLYLTENEHKNKSHVFYLILASNRWHKGQSHLFGNLVIDKERMIARLLVRVKLFMLL